MTSDKSYAVQARLDDLATKGSWRPATIGIADITTTGVKSLDFLTVPGGTAAATVEHGGLAYGTITNTATPPTGWSFYLYWGGTSGTQLVQFSVPSSGLVASISQAGWRAAWGLDWQSATECTGWMKVTWHTGSGAGNCQTGLVTFDVTSLSTTGDMNLTFAGSFGGGSGTTIHTYASRITRKG